MAEWLIVHTRAKNEFAAEEDLASFRAYCPRQQVRRRLRHCHNQIIVRSIPRFPNYLFCQADKQRFLYEAIRYSRYALSLVRFGGMAATITDKAVQELREADLVPPEVPLPIRLGDCVRVTQGLLEGRLGYVRDLSSHRARLSMQEGSRWASVKTSEITRA